ncbi:MAG: hypothetical protein AB8B55_20450 [Mariniblastus sp.]
MNTELDQEPVLTKAMLIHGVVADLLFQSGFAHAGSAELVDIAVAGTGLGILQNSIEFVKQTGSYWDTTQWLAVPRPFLDQKTLAYVLAIAAWTRGENKPTWADELPTDLKKTMSKSLKYLFATDDSFFRATTNGKSNLEKSQNEWLTLAEKKLISSSHLIALRQITTLNENLVVSHLRSNDRTILLHTINSVDRMSVGDVESSENDPANNEAVIDELRLLAGHRDNEVQAKSICVLTRLEKLDQSTIEIAGKLLESTVRFTVFAGLFSLSSLDSVPERILPSANRGFVRALKSCDYEFVNLFASGFNRWLDEPQQYLTDLLEHDSQEYLEIALESLENAKKQLVALD